MTTTERHRRFAVRGRPLTAYSAYLFDVDGTLLYPEHAVEGAAEALAALKRHGKAVLAVTNNSSLGRHAVADRFRQFGLPLEDREVFSALTATAQFVAHERPGARVHAFGNPGLWTELERFGLLATDETEGVEYLVMGNNRGVTYDGLTAALHVLLGGARWVAVNEDRTYVGPEGKLVPGVGAFVAALERMANRRPDVIVGKPAVTILHEAASSVGHPPAECLYIGDNPEADVTGAHAAGMHSLLVLTGVSATAESLPEQPDHVLPSVAELATLFP